MLNLLASYISGHTPVLVPHQPPLLVDKGEDAARGEEVGLWPLHRLQEHLHRARHLRLLERGVGPGPRLLHFLLYDKFKIHTVLTALGKFEIWETYTPIHKVDILWRSEQLKTKDLAGPFLRNYKL